MSTHSVTKPVTRAGIYLGVGLGGFVDGILFHQILQSHSMLSARLPMTSIRNLEVNMFWDGLFHTITLAFTIIGLVLLFRAHAVPHILWSGRVLTGAVFLGWGLFNLTEGIVNHHILHLHHVVEAYGQSTFDVIFLLCGAIFTVGGWVAIRSAQSSLRRSTAP